MEHADEKEPVSLRVDFAEAFGADDAGDGGGDKKPDGDKPKGGSGAGPGEGDAKPNDNNDPLAGVTLDQLLKHPTLGSVLNSWNDRTTNSRLEAERPRFRDEGIRVGRETAEQEQRNRYFSELAKTPDELARELAADPETAADYARWQAEQQQRQQDGDVDKVAAQAQVFALATLTQTYLSKIDKLPEEARGALKPDGYTVKGAEGMKEWMAAVDAAVVKAEAERIASEKFDEKWEVEKEQRQAALDEQRPGGLGSAGRTVAPKPDLIKTPTRVLFADAFK